MRRPEEAQGSRLRSGKSEASSDADCDVVNTRDIPPANNESAQMLRFDWLMTACSTRAVFMQILHEH